MKGCSGIRIFVALFPYDPATMSPNPGATEEELPFTEGQIIKVKPLFLLGWLDMAHVVIADMTWVLHN